MAPKPPQPMDALTLLFEAQKYGGLDRCVVYLPAGCRLTPYDDPIDEGLWVWVGHLYFARADGGRVIGEKAALAIASQNLATGVKAQIVYVAPWEARPCQCALCTLPLRLK